MEKNAHHGKFDHLLTKLDLLQKARTPKTFLAGGATFKNANYFGLKKLSTNANFNVLEKIFIQKLSEDKKIFFCKFGSNVCLFDPKI